MDTIAIVLGLVVVGACVWVLCYDTISNILTLKGKNYEVNDKRNRK